MTATGGVLHHEDVLASQGRKSASAQINRGTHCACHDDVVGTVNGHSIGNIVAVTAKSLAPNESALSGIFSDKAVGAAVSSVGVLDAITKIQRSSKLAHDNDVALMIGLHCIGDDLTGFGEDVCEPAQVPRDRVGCITYCHCDGGRIGGIAGGIEGLGIKALAAVGHCFRVTRIAVRRCCCGAERGGLVVAIEFDTGHSAVGVAGISR